MFGRNVATCDTDVDELTEQNQEYDRDLASMKAIWPKLAPWMRKVFPGYFKDSRAIYFAREISHMQHDDVQAFFDECRQALIDLHPRFYQLKGSINYQGNGGEVSLTDLLVWRVLYLRHQKQANGEPLPETFLQLYQLGWSLIRISNAATASGHPFSEISIGWAYAIAP